MHGYMTYWNEQKKVKEVCWYDQDLKNGPFLKIEKNIIEMGFYT